MRRTRAGLLLAGAACGLLFAGAGGVTLMAGQPDVRPTSRSVNCTTSGCHSAQTSRPFLHGPNAVAACDACHEYSEPAKHTFQLKRQGRELCDFCHIDKAGTEGPVVHKPVAEGNCLGCHDPHGSTNRRMLTKDTTPELCVTCHQDAVCGSNIHPPVGEDCTNCHRPHTSQEPKLLLADSRSLCLSCHQEVGETISGAKHPHDPAKGDCLQCHSPHASNQIKALKAAPAELCIACHDQVAMKAMMSLHPHPAATDGRACLNCHTPHGSMSEKQLAADPVGSCLECHKKPIAVAGGRTINAVPEIGQAGLHRHGPIEKNDCGGCHEVHGGGRDRLLTGNLSSAFYQPFSDRAYQLCLGCHKREAIVTARTLTETKFRDGDRNLHAVHVGTGPKAHNCQTCHSVHASKFEALINETATFGQWKLPINFAPAATGGSCSPGCHKTETYDREKASPPAPAKPTGAVGGVVNRAAGGPAAPAAPRQPKP